jgi:hypothetical protein
MDPLVSVVAARYAATKRLDLTWVEGLRKDFLTLLKNLPRVKDYKTAHELRDAFRVYRTNFDELFFEHFLNRDLKYNLGLSEEDAKWIDKKLRSSAWGFSIELSPPISFADDYHSEDGRFADFQREFPKWKARVQRKALVFWKEIKDFIEWFERVKDKALDVKVPTVENTTLEGFKLVMKGYNSDDEYNQKELEIFKEGLRLYRRRAASVAPILLQKQLPVVVEFKTTLDKGGEYQGDRITFYASSIISKSVPWVAHVMAHEMGHHLFRTYLSKEATDFWYQTIRGDFGDLDIQELLAKWPGDAWAYDFPRVMGDSDPILALQVDAISQNETRRNLSFQTKEDFQKLLDSGQKTISVPKTPITGYANKNPEEAFCETIGMLVAYGPQAVHERVRWWFDTAMPGSVKVATKQGLVARVAARFKAQRWG